MKAVIHLNVPDYQIGQPVSVYFKDSMYVEGICEADYNELNYKVMVDDNDYILCDSETELEIIRIPKKDLDITDKIDETLLKYLNELAGKNDV